MQIELNERRRERRKENKEITRWIREIKSPVIVEHYWIRVEEVNG